MNKYNVGDIVKLRDDLEDGEQYGSSDYLEKMGIMKNKPITILKIPELFKDCYVVVDEVGENWFLSDEMIEGLWEECKSKLKLIDVLNMIANGELKEGTKVKYDEEIYTFNDENELERELGFSILTDIYMNNLSDEVELIEPPCEHECIADIGKSIEPTKIEEIQSPEIYGGITYHIIDKLNEVIRKINKEQ